MNALLPFMLAINIYFSSFQKGSLMLMLINELREQYRSIVKNNHARRRQAYIQFRIHYFVLVTCLYYIPLEM